MKLPTTIQSYSLVLQLVEFLKWKFVHLFLVCVFLELQYLLCSFDEYEVPFLVFSNFVLKSILWNIMISYSYLFIWIHFYPFALGCYLSLALMGVLYFLKAAIDCILFSDPKQLLSFYWKNKSINYSELLSTDCVNSHLLIFVLFFFDLFWSTVLVLFIYSLWHPEYVYPSPKARVLLSHEFP